MGTGERKRGGTVKKTFYTFAVTALMVVGLLGGLIGGVLHYENANYAGETIDYEAIGKVVRSQNPEGFRYFSDLQIGQHLVDRTPDHPIIAENTTVSIGSQTAFSEALITGIVIFTLIFGTGFLLLRGPTIIVSMLHK